MPRLTIAVDITDSATTDETTLARSTLSGSTSVVPKKSSTPTGITTTNSSCS